MSDIQQTETELRRQSILGSLAAGGGYVIWGLSVIFYKQLGGVAPFEILAHRTLWSVGLIAFLIFVLRRKAHLVAILSDRKTLATLCLTAYILASNWFIFIWAINSDRVLETSLGYFINPLMSVLAGVLILREKLSRAQIAAMALAAAGVLYFTLSLGYAPWVSLFLAVSFAAYGYFRKITRVEALEGLFVEIAALVPAGIAYLVYATHHGGGHFTAYGWYIILLLALTGPMTTVPLLMFTYGAQRISLTTLGLLQYLVPTTSFIIAIEIYREPLGHGQIVTFALIWVGLAIFSFDTWRRERELRRHAVI